MQRMHVPRPGTEPVASRPPDHPQTARLSVVVISEDGIVPAPLLLPGVRPGADPAAVEARDDVVVLRGAGAAAAAEELWVAMGELTPPILVLAPTVDADDVLAAFRNGVTGYLIDAVDQICIPCVLRDTADGVSHVDPRAASVLVRHFQQSAADPLRREPITPTNRPAALSTREREIMELLISGHTPAEIAKRVALTEKTVRNYLSNIYRKLEVRSQSQAILLWLGRTPVTAR